MKKAKRLKLEGDTEKAKKLAKGTVQVKMSGANTESIMSSALEICKQFDLEEKSEIA